MKLNYICLLVVGAIVILAACLFISRQKNRENFPITSGMITPQRRFYGKCIDDCWRNFTGDTFEGQFNWLCTDECARKAGERVTAGFPDLTEMESLRHKSGHIAEPRMTTQLIEGDFRQLPYYQNEFDHCMGEQKTYAEQIFCPHNTNNYEQCVADYLRTREVACKAGLDWSWKP